MGLLETVFCSTEFDLNDDVLVKFNDYFAEEDKEYNSFSLDDEDFPALERFVQLIKHNDFASEIFVCTYGYEIPNINGQGGTWLITRSKSGNPQIIELTDCERVNNMVCLYWD